jgi:arsenite/tail-anchored protein-transporting ATPase
VVTTALERTVTLVGGKGGVGKTTTAAALATAHAAADARTLLVSTDPAHSTGDLLGARLGDAPTEVAPRLWAVEIDAEATADAHVERVRADARRLVGPEVRATVDRHLDLAKRGAGTLESAILDRLAVLLVDEAPRYDQVVVDTAPTGHTLRLLAMPELLHGWVGGLVRQRERVRGLDRSLANLTGDDAPPDDPVVERLRARAARLTALRRRFHEDTVIHLVCLPERLPVEETVRAEAALRDADLRIGAIVVNQVLPGHADGAFLAARREQQRTHLADIDRRLGHRQVVHVPQLPHDVRGPGDLAAIRAALGAAGLPSLAQVP